jgi:hypothetical protein
VTARSVGHAGLVDGATFVLVVADRYELSGRGVAVIGRVTDGHRPPAGTAVVITAAGRALWHRAGEIAPPADTDWILVRGVVLAAVPVGAVLTLPPADER